MSGMKITVKDSPYGGKYAVYSDGSRAPLPDWAQPDIETLDLIAELRDIRLQEDTLLHRLHLDGRRYKAPSLT